jgi:HSP20 family molecular chaperone IbpA
MYACPTATPCYGAENFFGYPTKTYASIFNKETPVTPFTAPSTPFERVPTYFPSTFERSTFGGYPWANYERFPSTWSNWTGYPSTWTGYPSTFDRFPSTWTGYPSTYERFPTTFPTWANFPGAERFFGNNTFFNKWNRAATCPVNNNSLCSTTFRPSSEVEWFTLTNPIRFFEDGTRGLWLCFDLRGYKPEEVCVSINKTERCIIVEASHDVKEHNIARKFYRKWALPEYMSKMDITKIEFKSFFGPDGLFYVEGVLPRCEEYYTWPAYPWTYSCWSNPTWSAVANKWNNTWWNNEWCNTNTVIPTTNWTNFKPVTCKFI